METNVQRTRTCERCKTVTPLNQVKLYPRDKSANMLVCENCSQELSRNKLESKVKPLPPPEYKWYNCLRCKYSFRVDASRIGLSYNLHCPYCGKADQLKKK